MIKVKDLLVLDQEMIIKRVFCCVLSELEDKRLHHKINQFLSCDARLALALFHEPDTILGQMIDKQKNKLKFFAEKFEFGQDFGSKEAEFFLSQQASRMLESLMSFVDLRLEFRQVMIEICAKYAKINERKGIKEELQEINAGIRDRLKRKRSEGGTI